MNQNRIKKVVIVGGGTAGWMAAASLRSHFRNLPMSFTLVESAEIGSVGVGEATTPTIRRFYRELGMRDEELMRACQATCKLGIKFIDWLHKGSSFIHPFALYGQDVKNVPFHHFWMKLRELGEPGDISEYCLGAQLAHHGKFSLPSTNPPSSLSVFDWALHFDASLFAAHLKKFALSLGVQHVDAKITGVKLRNDNGFIESLSLHNGEKIEGELFIDCSGFRSLLLGESMGVPYEDWGRWLLCDRAVSVQSKLLEAPLPYTRVSAMDAGWQWNIPLQHRQGNGHVYSSKYMDEDQAEATLLANIAGEPLQQARHFRFVPGRRARAWEKNCIALGLAAGFLEPLESTSIALVETGIEKIKLLFPDNDFNSHAVDEFNSMTALEYERVRDFLVLHYKASQREDTGFWSYCKNMDIPDTLQTKINLFKSRGHFLKYRWEMFQSPSWLALYSGFNIFPQTWDPMVDNYNVDYLQKSFAEMKRSVTQAVDAAQSHEDFLKNLHDRAVV